MVQPEEDNMLKITNDGRKLALDQRMINPMLPDYEGSKVNACADNIYKIWLETTEKNRHSLYFATYPLLNPTRNFPSIMIFVKS